ncbi:MAG: ATP-dependent DNA helicase [Candidatus Microsaccharimonas sp.]
MSFSTRYTQLNAAQKQAVDTIDGPVMVIAGPGTGKTELLSVRTANILQKTDTLPENILCLTFTESGQAAMRERLVGIIGKDAYKVAIHTFHSFGSEIMSHNREYFYRNALFEPADDLKQYEILRGIFEELEYSNPLSSTMNGEYTHLSDAKKVISELKRSSALTSDELLAVIDQNEATLDTFERILAPILADRVGKTTADKLRDSLLLLHDYTDTVEPLYEVTPLARIITDSLEAMLNDTISIHPTKPISAWKSSWFERNESKQLVFKDRKRLVKLKALSFVYYEYLSRMEKQSLFDYDDMIMQVVHAMEVNDDLKFNLQEKYLYIMVDEFQDTNLAQLRILHNLTDNPVNEGNPNILVVGDDDQAVYGFQGADVSNILNFSENYPARKLIVLTENYRSGKNILEASRAVITQGTDRLEERIPELDKQLAAHKTVPGDVAIWKANSIDAERFTIAKAISEAITAGTDPSSIAVLGRRHADIQSLLPFFRHFAIPIRYEREESVLDAKPIVALEQVARVVLALAEGEHGTVQALLPRLLSHPAWELSPKDIWRLSLDAYTNRQNWMEVMATTPQFVPIYEWLVSRASEVDTMPLEDMIDRLIGKTENEESPLFRYFFSASTLESHPEAYLECLSALRAIRSRLREYRPGENNLTLAAFIECIDLHRRLDIGITINRFSVASDVPAVQLLTAHKSKGLEFETVYLFNAVDSVWGQGARSVSRSISYPENLPLAPTGNSADERLRLFYVAITRAKNELIITFSDQNDSDKPTLPADFLLEVPVPHTEAIEPTLKAATETSELAWYQPFVETTTDLHTLLAPQIEKFKLSATSLNSFLDVVSGGPQYFLLNNLLHFPSAKSPSASYGTAIHRALQQAHLHVQSTGKQKPLEDTLHDFEIALTQERLGTKDFQQYLQQGSDHLPAFFTSGVLPMTPSQKAEVSFGYQDVRIEDARITGSLDMIDVDSNTKTMSVTDYKTGKPSLSWDKGDEFTKLKLHKYRQQLIFYKILVENSSEYHNYTVDSGQLAFIEPTKGGESILLSLNLSDQDIERTTKLIEAVWKRIVSLDFPDTSGYSQDFKGVLAFEQDLIDETV